MPANRNHPNRVNNNMHSQYWDDHFAIFKRAGRILTTDCQTVERRYTTALGIMKFTARQAQTLLRKRCVPYFTEHFLAHRSTEIDKTLNNMVGTKAATKGNYVVGNEHKLRKDTQFEVEVARSILEQCLIHGGQPFTKDMVEYAIRVYETKLPESRRTRRRRSGMWSVYADHYFNTEFPQSKVGISQNVVGREKSLQSGGFIRMYHSYLMPYEMAKAAETTIKWRLRPYRISNMNVGKVRSTEIFLIGANYLSGDIELYLRSNQIDYVKTEHMSSEELLLRGVPQQTVCQ